MNTSTFEIRIEKGIFQLFQFKYIQMLSFGFIFVNQQMTPVLRSSTDVRIDLNLLCIMKELSGRMRTICISGASSIVAQFRIASIQPIHWLLWHFGSALPVNPSNLWGKITKNPDSRSWLEFEKTKFYCLDFSFLFCHQFIVICSMQC